MTPKYLVTWDIPKDLNSSQTRLYREIDRLIGDGNCHRIASSVYLVSGERAIERAYTLAQLAAEFGAGSVGDEGGPQVHQIVEIEPAAHFENLTLARQIVERLRVDHRSKNNRGKSRDFDAVLNALAGEQAPTRIGFDEQPQAAFLVLSPRVRRLQSVNASQIGFARAGA